MAKIKFTQTLSNDRQVFLVGKEYDVSDTVAEQCIRGGVAERSDDPAIAPAVSGDMKQVLPPHPSTLSTSNVVHATGTLPPHVNPLPGAAHPPLPPNTVVSEVPPTVRTTTTLRPVVVQEVQHQAVAPEPHDAPPTPETVLEPGETATVRAARTPKTPK